MDTIILLILSILIHKLIGTFYFEARPFTTQTVNFILYHAPTNSFPSAHAMVTLAITLGIKKYRRLFILFLFLTLLTGVSRIYLGHHYPQDILLGWLAVIIIALFYYKVIKWHLIKVVIQFIQQL